jgi:hypothetical protein
VQVAGDKVVVVDAHWRLLVAARACFSDDTCALAQEINDYPEDRTTEARRVASGRGERGRRFVQSFPVEGGVDLGSPAVDPLRSARREQGP